MERVGGGEGGAAMEAETAVGRGGEEGGDDIGLVTGVVTLIPPSLPYPC